MAQRSSSISELTLLVLAMLLVGAICMPLWQWSATGSEPALFNPQRLGRMFLGWEQAGEYICFFWASFMLLQRWWQVRRQRHAFTVDWLPVTPHQRFVPEDAHQLQVRVEDVNRPGKKYLLGTMLSLALQKFQSTRSSQEASQVVRTWAELEGDRLANSLSTVHYLAWAIPALGFLGTVRGISMALAAAPALGQDSEQVASALQSFLTHTSSSLAIAFDTTFVALLLSLVLIYWLHRVQRQQEDLVLDCQEYVLEKLVTRFCDTPLVISNMGNGELVSPDESRLRTPKG
ncbi:MAG: MotA/TolQ/ExbB proton channel family protein [Gemmatales bacterium]|nr:MotA/TolQ/ExbB proton channel family protein [Gemmatales bacterium]MCS7160158.1 MotA/TolQ/ExbB proton channel family protein [Gemmatales bacterium]MDW8175358.1 MotA/TolQ/ExbB proton channel family protein [Gemmatales bacterium]MDW8223315.1 MotA/TolQ/ExbB proton channel family protein [Gemmatales bacterium]